MNVLRNSRSCGLIRRRPHVDTPEIDTYQRQIIFCEKKYDKLNKSFHIPELTQSGTSAVVKNVTRTPSVECWANTSSSAAPRNSRKNSVERPCNPASSQHRKSSLYAHTSRKRQGIPSPQQVNNANSVAVPARSSSESKIAVMRRGSSYYDNKTQHRRHSRKELESAVRNEGEKEKISTENLRPSGQAGDISKVEDAALEELNIALRREREQFLRALTTLAINRITTDKADITVPVERNTTFTHYERNIDVLADGSRLALDGDIIVPHLANDNYKDASSGSSSSGSEIYGANDGGTAAAPNPDKRERINRLRNYLKCSGLGDPNMIRTTIQRSADEKRVFSRLVKKVNRGLSYEKQERLRRRARLEYEMSLMKGESFCEQQEQVYMRTASADMENRDVQLLEEELRVHALREIRKSKKDTIHKHKAPSRNGSKDDLYNNPRHDVPNNGHGNEGDDVVVNGNEDGKGKQPDVDEKSSSDDRDAMSGLIRNPLSRREMRQRILLWVYDVEEAMGTAPNDGRRKVLEKMPCTKDEIQPSDSILQQ